MSDELQSLLRDLAGPYYASPKGDTAPARNLLADWVQDHPAHAHTVVAELLRMMPEILAPILAEGLTMEGQALTRHVGGPAEIQRAVTAGFRLTLRWHGLTVCQTEVQL